MNDTERFLTALTAPYADCPHARLELRCFAPGGQRTGRKAGGWYPVDAAGIERASADALRWGGERGRLEVYMGVLPRVQGGAKAEHLRRGGWLWAEIDGGDDGPHGARDLLTAAVDAGRVPRPHLIVLSGGGLHLYWRLANLAAVADDAGRERYRTTLRRIVRAIGGEKPAAAADIASAEPARILRVPGTFNRKREEPRAVRLLRCAEPDEASPARELVWWRAHLPAEPLPPRPRFQEGGRPRPSYRDGGDLPRAVLSRLTTPTPDGQKHYSMVKTATWAVKEGLSPEAVRAFCEQTARASGVPVDAYDQQRHLDNIVAWATRTVQPDYTRL